MQVNGYMSYCQLLEVGTALIPMSIMQKSVPRFYLRFIFLFTHEMQIIVKNLVSVEY